MKKVSKVNRPLLLVLICGLLLGLVLYSWQVALTAFNQITGLPEPVRLWAVEKTDGGRREGEFLGKKWLLAFPRRIYFDGRAGQFQPDDTVHYLLRGSP